MNNEKIKYLLIGKADELKEIGEYPSQPIQSWANDCRKIFNSYCTSGIDGKIEQRNKIKDTSTTNNHYYFQISEQKIFFICLVDSSYPEHYIFKLFDDIYRENIHLLRDVKGKLNRIGSNKLRDLVNNYQNMKIEGSIGDINNDLNDLKQDMKKNVTKIISNVDDVESLKVQSDGIKAGSDQFGKQALNIKRTAMWKNYKLMCIIAGIIIAIIAIIIIVVVVTKKSKNSNDNEEITIKIVDQNDPDSNSNSVKTLVVNNNDNNLRQLIYSKQLK